MLWTNHRVMDWLRSVDLSEYAPNLRGSGVHGALMVRYTLRYLETFITTTCHATSLDVQMSFIRRNVHSQSRVDASQVHVEHHPPMHGRMDSRAKDGQTHFHRFTHSSMHIFWGTGSQTHVTVLETALHTHGCTHSEASIRRRSCRHTFICKFTDTCHMTHFTDRKHIHRYFRIHPQTPLTILQTAPHVSHTFTYIQKHTFIGVQIHIHVVLKFITKEKRDPSHHHTFSYLRTYVRTSHRHTIPCLIFLDTLWKSLILQPPPDINFTPTTLYVRLYWENGVQIILTFLPKKSAPTMDVS